MSEIVTSTARVVEREVQAPKCFTFKMGVMVTGIALTALGLIASAFAGIFYLAATFFVTEISLILGTISLRDYQNLRPLTKVTADLKKTNADLTTQVSNLEEQITTLGAKNDELTITAEKMDSLYQQYQGLKENCKSELAKREELLKQQHEAQVRLDQATQGLGHVKEAMQAEIKKLSQETEQLRAEISRLEKIRLTMDNISHGTNSN